MYRVSCLLISGHLLFEATHVYEGSERREPRHPSHADHSLSVSARFVTHALAFALPSLSFVKQHRENSVRILDLHWV